MKCYTGYFWSYGTNAWVPYMEPAPALPSVGRSRSCASSESSYSCVSSYASSSSSVSSENSTRRAVVLRKRPMARSDRGRGRDSSRRVGSRSRSGTRRSQSSKHVPRVAPCDVGECRRSTAVYSPRRTDEAGDAHSGLRHQGKWRSSHGSGKSGHVADRCEKRNRWQGWGDEANSVATQTWDVSERPSSSKWPTWNWMPGRSWQWSKKRNNKKRGGWRVQAKRAATSLRSEKDMQEVVKGTIKSNECCKSEDDTSGPSKPSDARAKGVGRDGSSSSSSDE